MMHAKQLVTVNGRINDTPVMRALLTIEHEVRAERFERVDDPDPTWEFIDAAGHFHAWGTEPKEQFGRREIPTLTRSSRHIDDHGTECDLGDRCEGYDVTVWNCAICGEEIEPRYITRRDVTINFPGLTSWYVEAVVLDSGLLGVEQVTVRLGRDEIEYFGRAAVTGFRMDSDGPITLDLVGIGELRQRKRQAVTTT